MPNRIIKESACTSDTLAKLSADAERLWWRLVVQADDYGLFDGRPGVVLGKCLTAFVERFTPQQVEEWLAELEAAGLIQRYQVDGRPYLRIVTWSKHQRPPRAKEPKYPLPPEDIGWQAESNGKQPEPDDRACCQLLSSDSKCRQVTANAPENRESEYANRESGGEGGGVHAREASPADNSPQTAEEPDGDGHPPEAASGHQQDVEVLPPHTEAELRTLQVLRSIPGYPFDFEIDLDHIRTLAVDYPSLDLLEEAKRFRDYYRGKRSTKKANWRLRLRNWCAKAVEIQRERSNARASPYYRARDEDALDRRLREVGLA